MQRPAGAFNETIEIDSLLHNDTVNQMRSDTAELFAEILNSDKPQKRYTLDVDETDERETLLVEH